MDVTICVPVGRRPEALGELLRTLAGTGFDGRIVLAWCEPGIGALLQSLLREPALAVLDTSTIRGCGGSAPELRNKAVTAVHTRWCLFLDDDVVLGDGYCDELRRRSSADAPMLVFQGACHRSAPSESWLAGSEERLAAARLERHAEGCTLRVCDARNLLMPTEVARKFPFDERFSLGREGHQLARVLVAAGVRVDYAEGLSVLHHHRTTLRSLAAQKFRHGRGSMRCVDHGLANEIRHFVQHTLGPVRYLRQRRIPPGLVAYATLTAAFFCLGIGAEVILRRFSWSKTRALVTWTNLRQFAETRACHPMGIPELVAPNEVRVPSAYERLRDCTGKDAFRALLLERLTLCWTHEGGADWAARMCGEFLNLVQLLERDGALVLVDVISSEAFRRLVDSYSAIMNEVGSKSLLHSYLNLRNHPNFLTDAGFADAFLHPLFVALVAYRVGGPIQVVDARAKDAQPLSVQAQDNMLHIDNVPFRDEYKVLLCWEQGTCIGPQGQNFVYLPGTHRLFRNCGVTPAGQAFSTENASIFVQRRAIESLFETQMCLLGSTEPRMVEVAHERPTTILFAAGSLVHHRYRTQEGKARSAVILAFQLAREDATYRDAATSKSAECPLIRYVLGDTDGGSTFGFLDCLAAETARIGHALSAVPWPQVGPSVVEADRVVSPRDFGRWKLILSDAPTIEELKSKDCRSLDPADGLKSVARLMAYDKHGPLDLILYEDGHEEIRKWARNRIREMHADHLRARLRRWSLQCRNPSADWALSPAELNGTACKLAAWVREVRSTHLPRPRPAFGERIDPEAAADSLLQLVDDLGEAIIRCYSLQNFLSTSLFLFWSADEISLLFNEEARELHGYSSLLLRNYVASASFVHQLTRVRADMQTQSTPGNIGPPNNHCSGRRCAPPLNRDVGGTRTGDDNCSSAGERE